MPSENIRSPRAQGLFFGRRKGHKLRDHQADLMTSLLPQLTIDIGVPPPQRVEELFGSQITSLRLEIGFGGGEHLLAEADGHPATGFIGCEPYINGMAKILAQLASRPRSNVKLFAGDAADLLAWLPQVAGPAGALRDAEVQLREAGLELRRFLDSLEADPGRLDQVESELDAIASAKRRFGCASYEELLGRGAEARAELEAMATGLDPAAAAAEALAQAEAHVAEVAAGLRAARTEAAKPFAAAVLAHLRLIGLGEGEFVAELRESTQGPTGGDEVSFLIQANQGLPLAPVAETASGGELSRIALAIAAVAGGETLVFDEIDAGIGGETAHAVGAMLRELGERAQVVTITHLPQIASVAERHFSVAKIPGDPTHTRIEQLSEEERPDEIRRMLGGEEFLSLVSEGAGGA